MASVLASVSTSAASSPTAGAAGIPHRTAAFHPSFRVELPRGWVLAERGPDVVQIYRRCSGCTHEGDENGEITFDLALSKLSPAKAVASLRRTSGIKASRVRALTYGTLRGPGFNARGTGVGFQFPRSGYRSEPSGAPLRVLAVRAEGATVSVFIDPHALSLAKAPAYAKNAAGILTTVRFTK